MLSRDYIILFGNTSSVGDLTGDAYGNFAQSGQGAPTNDLTGDTYFRDTVSVDPNVVAATVDNGALVAGASGTGTTAAYTGFRLKEDVKSLYAIASFSDLSDAVAIIAASDVLLTSVVDSSIHITFSATAWALEYWDTVMTTVASGTYATLTFGKKYTFGWRISGTDVFLLLPTGVEIGPYSSSASTTRTNHAAIFEHFRAAAGPSGVKFYEVAANIFSSPTAAGRTNLFTQQNNLGNSPWVMQQLGTPTSGQADAYGVGTIADQVLETVDTNTHDFYQAVSKAASAVKYTMRCRVKPVGRYWYNLICYNGAFNNSAQCFYDLTNLAIGSHTGGFTSQAFAINALPNGFYQVTMDFTSDTNTTLYPMFFIATADSTNSYAGDVTKGAIVYDEWLFSRP